MYLLSTGEIDPPKKFFHRKAPGKGKIRKYGDNLPIHFDGLSAQAKDNIKKKNKSDETGSKQSVFQDLHMSHQDNIQELQSNETSRKQSVSDDISGQVRDSNEDQQAYERSKEPIGYETDRKSSVCAESSKQGKTEVSHQVKDSIQEKQQPGETIRKRIVYDDMSHQDSIQELQSNETSNEDQQAYERSKEPIGYETDRKSSVCAESSKQGKPEVSHQDKDSIQEKQQPGEAIRKRIVYDDMSHQDNIQGLQSNETSRKQSVSDDISGQVRDSNEDQQAYERSKEPIGYETDRKSSVCAESSKQGKTEVSHQVKDSIQEKQQPGETIRKRIAYDDMSDQAPIKNLSSAPKHVEQCTSSIKPVQVIEIVPELCTKASEGVSTRLLRVGRVNDSRGKSGGETQKSVCKVRPVQPDARTDQGKFLLPFNSMKFSDCNMFRLISLAFIPFIAECDIFNMSEIKILLIYLVKFREQLACSSKSKIFGIVCFC